MNQFHFTPERYLELMHEELPRYDELQEQVAAEDPLPTGPFGLVFTALAVHHLDGAGKRDLFRRVRAVLAPGGRFVLADVVVPEDPADAITPIEAGFDVPDRLGDQLDWLAAAGFEPRVTWSWKDCAVVAATAG